MLTIQASRRWMAGQRGVSTRDMCIWLFPLSVLVEGGEAARRVTASCDHCPPPTALYVVPRKNGWVISEALRCCALQGMATGTSENISGRCQSDLLQPSRTGLTCGRARSTRGPNQWTVARPPVRLRLVGRATLSWANSRETGRLMMVKMVKMVMMMMGCGRC
ncbi:hypothetical protein T440DRAFT_204907 [Plenodomus tracheiphilus IPT5]|uniref:Uncharacterized protein n=1 Tax=Plenodomus tracheiphilus IPT5 TaxID=1408161 RepID=A0A6A7BI63_9PLEO|nr:hypothetical protein T440DRAFT_204907 [Plenodomus tracheiphilus IPT5]